MTKMSEAQRIAILDAHNETSRSGFTYRGELPMFTRRPTIDALERNGWVSGPRGTGFRCVTTAGLIAAGVDMDALHAEALVEDFARRPSMVRAAEIRAAEQQRAMAVDNRAEIGAPRTQRFHSLFKLTRSWPAVLDHLHAEALEEGPDTAAVAPELRPTRSTVLETQRIGRVQRAPQDRSADGVPEVEQEHRPAPTFADDVAALRRDLDAIQAANGGLSRTLARLDRIAGAVPQRATDRMGVYLWQHQCGAVVGAMDARGQFCTECLKCYPNGVWQALYVLGGE